MTAPTEDLIARLEAVKARTLLNGVVTFKPQIARSDLDDTITALRTQAPDSWRPIAEHDNSADEVLVRVQGIRAPVVAWRHHPSSRTDMWLTVPGKYQVKPTEFCPIPALRPQTAESGK